ncbi:MAG: hypothetical protein WAM69_15275 [Candidatus Sulfotelmatobacter sp.]
MESLARDYAMSNNGGFPPQKQIERKPARTAEIVMTLKELANSTLSFPASY